MHGFQFEGHFHPLVQGFAQADDAAGAYPDARLLGGADDDFLVFHAVGGAHFREIGRCRFDVAVDSRDACFLQADGLLFGNEPQGAAHFDAYLLTNFLHNIDDFLKLIGIVLVSSAGDQGETDSAGCLGFLCRFQNFIFRKEPVYFGTGMVPARLGAELAVLLTVAASGIDNGTEIHCIAIEFLADFIRHSQKQHGILIFGTD